MNLGKTFGVGAVTLGLSFGALTLGAAGCGSTKQETKAEQQSCGAGSCSGEKKEGEGGEKSCGGEKKPEGGGEHSCGAGSCGK